MTDARLFRVEPVDMLESDEGSLLLYQHRLVALSPLGAATYELVGDGVTRSGLAELLIETFGEPPGRSLTEAVDELVSSLLSEGVLRESD